MKKYEISLVLLLGCFSCSLFVISNFLCIRAFFSSKVAVGHLLLLSSVANIGKLKP